MRISQTHLPTLDTAIGNEMLYRIRKLCPAVRPTLILWLRLTVDVAT